MTLAMLSGRWQMFTLGAKSVFWVQSWPLFYAVFHGVGMMLYARSARSVLLENGAGLALLTYDGITDVAWHSYCAVQSMLLVIPILFWGLVSGGGSAIAHMASTLTPDNSAALDTGMTQENKIACDYRKQRQAIIRAIRLNLEQQGNLPARETRLLPAGRAFCMKEPFIYNPPVAKGLAPSSKISKYAR